MSIARFGPRDVERLMDDAGIVRNRLKIESAVANAKAVLEVGSLGELVWGFVGGPHCLPDQGERLSSAGAARVLSHMNEITAALRAI